MQRPACRGHGQGLLTFRSLVLLNVVLSDHAVNARSEKAEGERRAPPGSAVAMPGFAMGRRRGDIAEVAVGVFHHLLVYSGGSPAMQSAANTRR